MQHVNPIKICRADTLGKIFTVEDVSEDTVKKNVFDEGRLRLNIITYDRATNKAIQQLSHYVNTNAFLLACEDLVSEHIRQKPDGSFISLIDEYKGGPGSSVNKPEWPYFSRRFTMDYAWSDKTSYAFPDGKSVRFSIAVCEGTKEPTGIFKPKNHQDEFSGFISIPLQQARVLASTVLRYIKAKTTGAMVFYEGNFPEYAKSTDYVKDQNADPNSDPFTGDN